MPKPIAVAAVAGIAVVWLLPPLWLAPLSAAVATCAVFLAIIVRLDTKTVAPANPMVGALLWLVNLPEQPLARAKEGWALTTFLVSAAFLVSLGLSVVVRAHA